MAGFAAAIAAYAAIPLDTWLQTAWQVVVGFAAAGTIVAVVRRSATAAPTAWLWCAAGIALNATGSFAEAFFARVLHDDGWPTPASLFYESLYLAFAIGMVHLIRRRSRLRDWSCSSTPRRSRSGSGCSRGYSSSTRQSRTAASRCSPAWTASVLRSGTSSCFRCSHGCCSTAHRAV